MQLAQSYLQGMGSPFDGVFESYGQGQTLRQNSDLLKAQQAEQARKLTAQERLENLDWNDQSAIAQVVAQFPEYTKGAKDWYDQMEAKEQRAKLNDMSRYISVLRNGRPELATTELREKARILAEGGSSDAASELLELAEQIDEDPKSMLNALSMSYAAIAPKDAVSGYKDLSTAYGDQDRLPSDIGKINADTDKTSAESLKLVMGQVYAAAASLDSATFKRSIAQLRDSGQLTEAQHQELDDMLVGTPEQVKSVLQYIAKQSPEYAIAYKPSMDVVDSGGYKNLVQFDPQTGTVETKGAIQNTVSPNQQYASDSSVQVAGINQDGQDRRSQLAARVSRLNAQDAKDAQMYGIDVKAKGAAALLEWNRQKADLDSKKGKRVTQKDGRVFIVYPDGTGREAIDKDGKPLIDSGRKDPKIDQQFRAEQLRQEKLKPLLGDISTILDRGKATGSVMGAAIDATAKLWGANPYGSLDAAKLDALGGQLVMMMPRMEGPQSDKDVDLYKQMAGRIGSRTTSIEAKKAALQTITDLNKKYEQINNKSQVKADDLF